MPVIPLSKAERVQLDRHINAFQRLRPERSASRVAEIMFNSYEERAGGFPRTRRSVKTEGRADLSVMEARKLYDEINVLTALVEGRDGSAADAANEMLDLFEELALGIAATGRDVTKKQLS